jgi:hypothetical protein
LRNVVRHPSPATSPVPIKLAADYEVELAHRHHVASNPAQISPPGTLDLAGASRFYGERKPCRRSLIVGVSDFGKLI